MQKEAVTICRELDLPYYNTKDKVDASRYPKDFCVHFMHPSAGGHRVLGEHLARELADRGWL
jgi:lysophospholipase L1-like esterase